MYKNKLFILSLLITLFSCNFNNKYCDDINSVIDDIFKSDSKKKIIDLKLIYNFEWDTLLIFDEYTTREDILEETGIDCKCDFVPDKEKMYFFIKDNKLVKKVLGECRNYNFDINSGKLIKIPYNNSVFKVRIFHNHYILYR